MSPKLHVSVFAAMLQPATAGLIVQLMPPPVGSESLSETVFAVPGPLLVTAIVKPIEPPAGTEAASAVLVITSAGQFTVIDACCDAIAVMLVAETLAWF